MEQVIEPLRTADGIRREPELPPFALELAAVEDLAPEPRRRSEWCLQQQLRDAAIEVGGFEGDPLVEQPRVQAVLLLGHPLRLDARIADRERHTDAVASADQTEHREHEVAVAVAGAVPRLSHGGPELQLI